MEKIKVVFMGTPEFAVAVLESLINSYDVCLVVTQPDKMVGRHQEVKYSAIKEVALKNNIEVFQPVKIREDYEKIREKNPDIIITCAYGQIIPKVLLDLPRLGCINVHASLLPKLRGGAPIHKALIWGEEKTGVTIMYMDEKMDTGDIISQEEYVITREDDVGTLHDKLSEMGAKLLIETLPSIINGSNKRIKQDDSKATYAYNITREEEHLEFNKSAKELHDQVRGLYPWPLANLILNDEEIKITKTEVVDNNSDFSPGTIIEVGKEGFVIKTKDGGLLIKRLKPFGKREMDVKDYLNGVKRDNIINRIVR